MFTGIIEHVGTVKAISRSGGSAGLVIDVGPLAADAGTGDSVAVSGVCLTVTSLDGSAASFDVSGETLSRTMLGKLRSEDTVNLERALRADSRLGGHFVQGHVDGLGKIRRIERKDNDRMFEFSVPKELQRQMVEKGSVAVDGISVTAASITPHGFTVAVIPHTFENTTLGRKKVGDEVNIEVDVLGKYVRRFLAGGEKGESDISREFLERHGF